MLGLEIVGFQCFFFSVIVCFFFHRSRVGMVGWFDWTAIRRRDIFFLVVFCVESGKQWEESFMMWKRCL